MKQPIAYSVFQGHTVLLPLRHLYPECSVLIQDNPRMENLQCLFTSCHKNNNCMEALAKRVFYFFNELEPGASQLVSYYKVGQRIKAGIFTREMQNPRVAVINQHSLKRVQERSIIKQWEPSEDYIRFAHQPLPKIIPVESLIR